MDVNELKKALSEGDNAQLFEQIKEKLGGTADLSAMIAALKEKLGSAASGNSLVESLQNMLMEDKDGDGSSIDDMLEKFGLTAEQADTAASFVDKIKGMFGFGAKEEAQETEDEAEDDGSVEVEV